MATPIIGETYGRYAAKALPPLTEKDHALISDTVSKLCCAKGNTPGMLLGKIQSGKTRSFVGIIAMAFDNGFDVAVVFTKNSLALARQTSLRISRDLYDDGNVAVHDIKYLNGNLDTSDFAPAKLVLVVKKEDDNLKQLISLFPRPSTDGDDLGDAGLRGRRVLVIDDEADNTSVGYKSDGKLQRVHELINEFRCRMNEPGFKPASYLQVTATPYALYLQSNNDNGSILPVKPSFTSIIEPGDGYVGTEYFFGDDSEPAQYAVSIIPKKELLLLEEKKRKRKKGKRNRKSRGKKEIANPLGLGMENLPGQVKSNYHLTALRSGLVGFVMACAIRELQDGDAFGRRRYAFVVHTDTDTRSHERQNRVVCDMLTELRRCARHNPDSLTQIFATCYLELAKLAESLKRPLLPPLKDVKKKAIEALVKNRLGAVIVNSKVGGGGDVDEKLFDEHKGELKKPHPMTVFIGGNVLDRGLTISQLIGFYYGRNPDKAQQDSTLQHMRILGYRSREDLAVTRMFCSSDTLDVLETIHRMDIALRERLLGKPDHGSGVFVSIDPTGRVVPCPANKLRLSRTTTYSPGSRDLPVGFRTNSQTQVHVEKIESSLRAFATFKRFEDGVLVPLDLALQVMRELEASLSPEAPPESLIKKSKWKHTPFVWEHTRAALKKMSQEAENADERGRVWIIARGFEGKIRDIARFKDDGKSFSDAPDSSKTDTADMRKLAKNAPGIILLKQAGLKINDKREERGWFNQEFIWPVVISPEKMKDPIVFAHELRSGRDDAANLG